MAIKKDELGRHILNDKFEDMKIFFDVIDTFLMIYVGHEHPAVNQRFEDLDASLLLNKEEVSLLIGMLIWKQQQMEEATHHENK
ncbi:hypothetical protein [Jeotgalibaca porci]|uniref:hypothetical protein n=1 Tax=Jeotgalibaca porci TaxID=1868793 RepID=UPI0035A07BEE